MSNAKLRLIALYDGIGDDRSAEFAKFMIEATDPESGFLTFASAREGGGDDWVMKATIPQDYAAGSVWSDMWNNPGDIWTGYYSAGTGTDVIDLDDATAGTPVFEFEAIISTPRGTVLGGEANKAVNATPTVDIEWKLTGKPIKHTAAVTP